MGKAELRANCLARRLALDAQQCAASSSRIRMHLHKLLAGADRARLILAYLPFRKEPDLSALFEELPLSWALPRVVGSRLTWHTYDSTRLVMSEWGVHEPDPSCPSIKPDSAALVLVPLVACDERGYRIGYGGGFYDRFLSVHQLATLGVGYGEFVLPYIPADPWDQTLDGVVTEAGVRWFKSNNI
ncbi:MAG: 5-formyltetrahydrofolate cyclo-ligase [Gemmatimonadaceae bacterium]|nr:5-formyltetrahydrofolate cyclo-ligase [Gloeobacterales cyanobacterium ES-bin-141]